MMTADKAAAEEAERTDLSDLLNNRMAELGLSYRTAADATVDPRHPEAGPLYKRGTLENLLKNRVASAPSEAQCRALHAAFRVPLVAVQRAVAAQYQGYVAEHWDRSEKARVLIARIDEMGDGDIDRLNRLVDVVLDDKSE
ncbi:XRE family transcriptional regulator [Strepomyces sp. STD 3.1]|nr:XRE family transcriptional regulator [Streptomyces sp. STD 3.1]